MINFVEEEQQAAIPEIIAVEKSICFKENKTATLKDKEVSLAEVLPNETVTLTKDVTKDFVGFLLNLGERPHDLKEDKIAARTFKTEGVKSIEDEKELASKDFPIQAWEDIPTQAWVYLPKVQDESVDKVVTQIENKFHAVGWDLAAKHEVNMNQVGTFAEECDVPQIEVANDISHIIEHIKLSVDISNVEEASPLWKSVLSDVAVLTNEKIENTDIAMLEEEIIASKGAMYMPSNEAMFDFEDVPFSIEPWVYIPKVQETRL
jgi:hypothetical protein